MKKIKKNKLKNKVGFLSNNRVTIAIVAGAVAGLAITYLLSSEKGRDMLSQAGHSVKSLAGNLKMPVSNGA